jgi:hypothetical protein
LLVNWRRDPATSGDIVRSHREHWTIFDPSTVVGALIDGFLQMGDVPAIDEVTVEAVAGWITHRPHKRLFVTIPHIVEFVNAKEHFVEQGDEMDRMRGWARAIIMAADRIGHVGLVIRRVEVLAIPTWREEDLGTKATRAFVGGKAIGFGCCWSIEVQAGIIDCGWFFVIAKASLHGVTSDHAKPFWKSGKLFSIPRTLPESKSANSWDSQKCVTYK